MQTANLLLALVLLALGALGVYLLVGRHNTSAPPTNQPKNTPSPTRVQTTGPSPTSSRPASPPPKLHIFATTCVQPNATNCVYEFRPTDSIVSIKNAIEDSVAKQGGKDSIWGAYSFAFMFHPGRYDFGSYTIQVASNVSLRGLGLRAEDTVLANCMVGTPGCPNMPHSPATDTFWRDLENLRIEGYKPDGTNLVSVMWYTSQACPARRLVCDGDVQLDSPTVSSMWASGGFMADAVISGTLYSRTQQQFCFRNVSCKAKELYGGMNWVMIDCTMPGLDSSCTTGKSTTVLTANDVSGSTTSDLPSKPYLTDVGIFTGDGVLVAALGEVLIAYASSTSLDDINKSKYVILTSGTYAFPEPITADIDGKVILGVGWPLLKAGTSTSPSMLVTANNVTLAGLLFEAGTGNPDSLLALSKPGGSANLFDIFCRMLTPPTGTSSCKTMVTIDQDNCYLESLWLWVADHQTGGSTDWLRMDNPTGLLVNGTGVVALDLQVEHQRSAMVDWRGAGGRCVFYQSEFPYANSPQDGSASYVTSDKNHVLTGAGVYFVVPGNSSSTLSAVQAPKGAHLKSILGKNWASLNGLKYTIAYDDGTFAPPTPMKGQYTVC